MDIYSNNADQNNQFHKIMKQENGRRLGKKNLNKSDSNLPIVVSSFEEMLEEKINLDRYNLGIPRYCDRISCLYSKGKMESFFNEIEKEGYIFHYHWKNSGSIYKDNDIMRFNINDNTIEFDIFGDKEFISFSKNIIGKHLETYDYFMKWVYNRDGESVHIPIKHENLPVTEMYPFLGDKSLTQYYDEYLDSSSNTLLLIGPPGTGKTTFLKGLLSHAKESAIVSYKPDILEDDSFFVNFIKGPTKFLIMEDSDNFLKSRKEGNDVIQKFLNVSDGLVTVKGKKLIFTTNLPSTNDIDEALLRPGRCFDVLNFELLNKKQAEKLAKMNNIKLCSNKEYYSIAEIFNQEEQEFKQEEKTIGFV